MLSSSSSSVSNSGSCEERSLIGKGAVEVDEVSSRIMEFLSRTQRWRLRVSFVPLPTEFSLERARATRLVAAEVNILLEDEENMLAAASKVHVCLSKSSPTTQARAQGLTKRG